MNKLEKAKEIITEHIDDAKDGIFCTRNVLGDTMSPLYHYHYEDLYNYVNDFLHIDICYQHEYFEVFGLSDEEFNELKIYYEEIRKEAYNRYWEKLREEAYDRFWEELLKDE